MEFGPMKTEQDFFVRQASPDSCFLIVASQTGSAAENYKDNASEKSKTVFL
jgi:hypothetical protein